MSGIVKNYESLIGGFEGGMTVTTFTPSLDGHVGRENTNESWSTKLAGAGNVSTHTGTAMAIRMSSSSDSSNRWRTFRTSMVLFDTSAIGSSIITSATFQVALNNKTDYFSDSMSLVNATPASNSALADADWQEFGTTKQASDKTIASFSTDGSYNTMELNATGLAAINKTGITKYGFTFTSLIDDDENTWASDQVGVLSVQSRGGTNPPQLVVTHTSPGGYIAGNADTHTKGSGADVQIFTTVGSNRTWIKPAWATTVYIEVIGGGGAGPGGGARYVSGAGGGGGGAMARGIYPADSLPTTLTVNVGEGGTAGVAATDGPSGSYGADGGAGVASIVSGSGFLLSAYGGGFGRANNGTSGTGGGGGGTGSVGANGLTQIAGVAGGNPTIQGSTQGDSLGGRGGQSGDSGNSDPSSGTVAGNAEYGGAGGAGGVFGAAVLGAGSSIYGAGGGGANGMAGGINAGDGGAWSSYDNGGGGAKATGIGATGTAGTSRGYGCGDGGGGGMGFSTDGNGGGGGNGGIPGGGGGPGGGTNSGDAGGTGGAGGRGEVRIFSW